MLNVYDLDNYQDNVLANTNRHSPAYCDCGAVFKIDILKRKPKLL